MQAIRKWLRRISEEKRKLLDWCDKAQERVHYKGRTGQKTGRTSLFVLVQLLNGILNRYMGDVISTGKRSTGERNFLKYVIKVCIIAKPDLLEPWRAEKKARVPIDRAEKTVRFPIDRAEGRVKKVIEAVLKEYYAEQQTYPMQDWEALIPDWVPAKKLSLRNSGIGVYFRRQGTSSEWLIRPSRRTPLSSFPVMFPPKPFVPKDVARRQSKARTPAGHGQQHSRRCAAHNGLLGTARLPGTARIGEVMRGFERKFRSNHRG